MSFNICIRLRLPTWNGQKHQLSRYFHSSSNVQSCELPHFVGRLNFSLSNQWFGDFIDFELMLAIGDKLPA